MTDTQYKPSEVRRENERLRAALRDAVEGEACWLPRAMKLLAEPRSYNPLHPVACRSMADHRSVVDGIRERARVRWVVDIEDLQTPTEPAPDPGYRREVAGYVWACMSAAVAMGVPRKTVAHIFDASVATVDRARRQADQAAALALCGASCS